MMRQIALLLVATLASCTPLDGALTPNATRAAAPGEVLSLPPVRSFDVAPQPVPRVSNVDLARDFLDLAFRLENGVELPVFTRFEGPITVRVAGDPPPSLGPDLARLLDRLRREARLNIAFTNASTASVTIEALPKAQIQRALPQAACFVVPNVSSLREYRRARGRGATSWGNLMNRTRLAIIVPSDSSPQELRDCLHEELAQAVGPLNDLYRLPYSVFNDDNVHTVLTGFDMLVLRAYYHPSLRNGMTRDAVAARLPDILAHLNPGGAGQAPALAADTPLQWSEEILTALAPGADRPARRRAALRAVHMAQKRGWSDHRTGFALYAAGRLVQRDDPAQARVMFANADALFRKDPNARLHRAYLAVQLGAHALAAGEADTALSLLTPQIRVATDHENAALLATLQMLRAEALELAGRYSEAREVRLDSLGWARYGFGPEWAVRAKLREIASLNPAKGRS